MQEVREKLALVRLRQSRHKKIDEHWMTLFKLQHALREANGSSVFALLERAGVSQSYAKYLWTSDVAPPNDEDGLRLRQWLSSETEQIKSLPRASVKEKVDEFRVVERRWLKSQGVSSVYTLGSTIKVVVNFVVEELLTLLQQRAPDIFKQPVKIVKNNPYMLEFLEP